MSEQTTSQKLYDLLVSRNLNPKAKDNQGDAPDVSKATRFVVDFVPESGKNYGTIVVLLGDDSNLDVFFGDNLGKTMEGRDKDEWYDLLLQLKQFATRNFLTFNTDNINKLQHRNLQVNESWQGKGDTSWNGDPTQARLLIRHKKKLGEGEARHRYVESLFIETTDGERYKLGFKNLTAGKAMLEHVRQGGKPYDPRGLHITGLVEELAVLTRFRRANAGQIFEGEALQLINETDNYYHQMQGILKHLGSSRGYQAYFESWNPTEITEQDVIIEDFKNLFVKQTIDPRIEQALPVLARITNEDSEMKEAALFESWVNNLAEGTWSLPETPEQKTRLIELLGQELPVGPDATNATEQLGDLIGDDILFDQLGELADKDADADARPVIIARMEELSSSPDVAEVLSQVSGELQDQGVDQDQDINDIQSDVEGDEELPQSVEEAGQQWPDTSNSLAQRKAVVPNMAAYRAGETGGSNAGRPGGMTVATRVDPTITPTSVKKLGSDRPIPSFLQKGVAEGEPGDLEHELEKQEYHRDQQRDQEAEKAVCNHTTEGQYCPEHGLKECNVMEYTGNVTNFGLEESDAVSRVKALAFGEAVMVNPGTSILSPNEKMVNPGVEKTDTHDMNQAMAQAMSKGSAPSAPQWTRAANPAQKTGLAAKLNPDDVVDVDAKEVSEDDIPDEFIHSTSGAPTPLDVQNYAQYTKDMKQNFGPNWKPTPGVAKPYDTAKLGTPQTTQAPVSVHEGDAVLARIKSLALLR